MNFVKVHSTQIHSLAWDGKTGTLVVVFEKDSVPSSAYAYKDIFVETYNELLLHSDKVGQKVGGYSVGRLFDEKVKKAGAPYVPVPLGLLRLEAPDPSCPAGTEVHVTWGEEVFCPRPYQSFRLGPFSMTTKTKEGETPGDAAARALAHLDGVARMQFALKREGFFDRLEG